MGLNKEAKPNQNIAIFFTQSSTSNNKYMDKISHWMKKKKKDRKNNLMKCLYIFYLMVYQTSRVITCESGFLRGRSSTY